MPEMKKVGGHEYLSLGVNNYSCNMDPIIFSPKNTTVQQVIELESEGVYLHPTKAPDLLQIFAVKGTLEQYKEFYTQCAENDATKKACMLYGLDFQDETTNKLRADLIEYLFISFEPWYKK